MKPLNKGEAKPIRPQSKIVIVVLMARRRVENKGVMWEKEKEDNALRIISRLESLVCVMADPDTD